jgi:ABC-type oligopeptide transport system substrate-binding subunit
MYNFYIDSWARLGIQVTLDATDYNKFQKKMFDGAYQLFTWGWLADYPDPENFLFLLHGPNSSRYGPHRPNSARFEDARYDRLFRAMANIRNDETGAWMEPDPATGEPRRMTAGRGEIIREMKALLERECPWIPLFHQELYYLYHQWLKDVKPFPITDSMTRFHFVDTEQRARQRLEWNRPIRWPAVVLVIGVIAFLVPAILTMRRERR